MMKRTFAILAVIALVFIAIWTLSGTSKSEIAGAGEAEKREEVNAEMMYREAFLGHVVLTLGDGAVLLRFLDEGDYEGVRSLILSSMQGSLQIVDSETNHAWTATQYALIDLGRERVRKSKPTVSR